MSATPLFSRLSKVLPIALLLILSATSRSAELEVLYRGLDKAHLRYTLADYEKITLVTPDAAEGDLLTGPASQQVYLLTDLQRGSDDSPKTYRFNLYTKSGENWNPSPTNPLITMNMNDQISGEPQTDEAITGENAPEDVISGVGVVLKSGRSLTIKKFAFAGRMGAFVTPADWQYAGAQVDGGGSILIEDCSMASMQAQGAVDFELKKCLIRDDVSIYGAPVKVSHCEIAGDIILHNRCEADFSDNLLLGMTKFQNLPDAPNGPPKVTPFWEEASSPNPALSGNAIMGKWALWYSADLPPSPIPIGLNYYGDPEGYVRTEQNSFGLFQTRGGIVHSNDFPATFDIPSYLSRNPDPVSQRRTFPKFWLRSTTVGQNVIPTGRVSSCLQGRETLACIDVVTDAKSVDGAKIYASLAPQGGQGLTVYSQDSDKTVHRDHRDYGYNARDLALSTYNFILPPMSSDAANVSFYIDSTGVTGYEGSGTIEPLDGYGAQMLLDRPYSRPLRVLVVPVQLLYPFYDVGSPSAGGMADKLRKMMVAMLPLRNEDLVIHMSSPVIFMPSTRLNSVFAFQTILSYSSTLTMNAVANNLWLRLQAHNLSSDNDYDYVVGVLRRGNMGKGIDGASWIGRRSVILVSEGKAAAALHEMGHANGLYTLPFGEQYELYPELGIELKDVTAFVPERGLSLKQFKAGAMGRIQHHPPESSPAYIPNGGWFDVMGAGLGEAWMIPDTYQTFRNSLRSLLGTASSGSRKSPSGDVREPAPPGMKRIALQGLVELEETDAGFEYFKFVEGAVRGFAEGSVLLTDLAPPALYPREKVYYLRSYDAADQITQEVEFSLELPDWNSEPPPYYAWMGVFRIPDDTARYEVVRKLDDKVYLGVEAADSLTLAIDSPAPGAGLGAELSAQWTATAVRPDPLTSAPQPLQYAVWFRSDGDPWALQTLNCEGRQFTLPTDFLPRSDDIEMMVSVSDGLRTVEATVGSLSLGNRPPTVSILTPSEGDEGATSTLWQLSASVYDLEDSLLDRGIWTSSLDGGLGTGTVVSNVPLSEGTHVLTFSTSDSEGLAAEASVNVSVNELTDVDLGVEPADLAVVAIAADPSNFWPQALNEGTTATVRWTCRALGLPTTGVAALYWTPPGGTESALFEQVVELSAFGEEILTAQVLPAASGDYEFRAALGDLSCNDPDPSNNERTWNLSTDGYAELDLIPPALVFDDATVGAPEMTAELVVTNSGDAELVIDRFDLTGPQVREFGFVGAPPSVPLQLAPQTSTTLTLRFSPLFSGDKEARIDVECNDPLKTSGAIPLLGYADLNEPLVQRIVLSLLGATPPTADCDANHDGVVDIADYIYSSLTSRRAGGERRR